MSGISPRSRVGLVSEQRAYPVPREFTSNSIPSAFFSAPDSGILWDMDGTLVESKQIWWHLCSAASMELGYGLLDYDAWEPTFGQSVDGYQRAFFPEHSVAEIDDYINSNFERFVEHLHILPGCEDTLEAAVAALGGDVSRMAICTNSPLPIVQVVMKHCPTLRRFFTPERTFCAGDLFALETDLLKDQEHELHRLALSPEEREAVAEAAPQCVYKYQIKAKPTGDLIFASSHRLGVRSDLCLFVGDSKFDLMSSTASGCFAVGIAEKAHGGHLHVDNIAELGEKLAGRNRK